MVEKKVVQGDNVDKWYQSRVVVSTHLKNASQLGSFPQVGVKIKMHLKPPPGKVYVGLSPPSQY